MLNIDWYQPYKRRKDISVWAMCMALLNLPRDIIFLRENMMLVGLIPAFTSEPKHLNDFLRPVVSDLLMLWTNNGITKAQESSI